LWVVDPRGRDTNLATVTDDRALFGAYPLADGEDTDAETFGSLSESEQWLYW